MDNYSFMNVLFEAMEDRVSQLTFDPSWLCILGLSFETVIGIVSSHVCAGIRVV